MRILDEAFLCKEAAMNTRVRVLTNLGVCVLAGLFAVSCGQQQKVPVAGEESARPASAVPVQGAKEKHVLVVAVGDVDGAVVTRIAKHMQADMKCIVSAGEPVVKAENAAAAVNELGKLLSDDVVCVLGLTEMEEKAGSLDGVSVEGRAGVVNLAAYRPNGKPVAKDAEENYLRRIDKEATRAVGLMLSLEPCVMPLCALCKGASEEDLDRRGRTPCPPCQDKRTAKLKEMGVQIRDDL